MEFKYNYDNNKSEMLPKCGFGLHRSPAHVTVRPKLNRDSNHSKKRLRKFNRVCYRYIDSTCALECCLTLVRLRTSSYTHSNQFQRLMTLSASYAAAILVEH